MRARHAMRLALLVASVAAIPLFQRVSAYVVSARASAAIASMSLASPR